MSFWKKVKQTAIADRLVEEKLYELVHRELESGERRDGLWAKAFQNSQGDEQKTNALYIGYRVQSIKDEAEITDLIAEKYEAESKKPSVKLDDKQDKHEQEKAELLKCRRCGYIFNKSQLTGDLCKECAIFSKMVPPTMPRNSHTTDSFFSPFFVITSIIFCVFLLIILIGFF
jgi:hypothetical protein